MNPIRRLILAFLLGSVITLLPTSLLVARITAAPDRLAYRLSRPAMYARADYWSEAFIRETAAIKDVVEVGYIKPADFVGNYVNVRDGYRVTVGQPAIYDYTLWLVGNSATFDYDLPDQFTTASQLQALLPDVRVVNVGMIAADVLAQRYRLEDLPVVAGDMVVFMSGGVDASHWGEFDYYQPASIERGIREARAIAISKGARFVHILQVNVYGARLTKAEYQMIDLLHAGKSERYRHAFEVVYAEIKRIDPDVMSAEHCLNEYRAEGWSVFVTQTHIADPVAAKILAACLYDLIYSEE